MQRQALASFQLRFEQLLQQQRDQQKVSRTAAQAVQAAQQALQNHQNDMNDLQADKTSLQHAAEEIQQQLATNSQVEPCACLISCLFIHPAF